MNEKRGKYGLAALVAVYTTVFSIFTVQRHVRLETHIFDLGIFDQGVYLLSKGLTPFLTTRGVYLQEDHFHPILYLLAPLYWVFSSPKTLLVVQSLIIALGAIPAYYLARRYEIEPRWALLIATAYLCQPSVTLLNRFDFHPVSIMMTSLVFAIWFLESGRPLGYGLALIVAACCTEASGFTLLFLAINAFLVRGARWAASTGAIAVIGIVASRINQQAYEAGSPYSALFYQYGADEKGVILHLLTHPFEVAWNLLTPVNLLLLFYLFSPLAFLSFGGPLRLLPMLPALAGNLLSWRHAQHRIGAQYGVALTPFLLWAAIAGWAFFKKKKAPEAGLGAFLTVTIAISLFFGPLGPPHITKLQPVADLHALETVATNEVVSADNAVGSHLSHRPHLYLFPNPMLPTAWGNNPEALVQQSTSEYRPLRRGAFRRGLENTNVDRVVLRTATRNGFPLSRQDYYFCRQQLIRSKSFQSSGPQGDLILFQRVGKIQPASQPQLAWTEVRPSLSHDGQRVAFETQPGSSQAFGRHGQGATDIVVVDRQQKSVLRRLSSEAGSYRAPALSGDGQFLVFCGRAQANPLENVFFTQVDTDNVEMVTAPYRDGGRGNCLDPSISNDGQHLAFPTYRPRPEPKPWYTTTAFATRNELSFGTPYHGHDVNERIALSPDGDRRAWERRLYLEGRVITDVIVAERDGNPRTLRQEAGEPTLSSRSCAYVLPDDSGVYQIQLHDFESGSTIQVTQGDDDSLEPALSADGRYLCFSSYASNLVPEDNNGHCDVFWLDLETQEMVRVTSKASDGSSYNPTISGDGSTVAFASLARDLTATEEAAGQVYVWEHGWEHCEVLPFK